MEGQYIGPSWRVIFDFSPNGPDFKEPTEGEWSFSEAFAQVANEALVQRVFEQTKANEEQLRAIGLWAVPCLAPHPLNAVVHLVQDGHVEDARSRVVEHCSDEFLRERLGHWTGVQEFVDRATLFQEALEAHSRGWFHLSISACLPHVEGVITDWLHRMLPAGHDVKWRTGSKARQFSDLLSNNAGGGVGYHAFSSVGDFISGGPVLSTFKTWTESIDTSFANRHVIGHGRYEASVYTKEASIKVFLLLDSMHWVISRLGQSGGDDAGQ